MEFDLPSATPAQQAWLNLRFGMLVVFGLNTFYDLEWSDGTLDPAGFDPTKFAPDQWAQTAAEAGMKYMVVVAKHHDGFCLWPTAKTDYSIQATKIGRERDVLGEICAAFRARGLQVGIYYSLWDRYEPCYEDDEAYAQFMMDQLTELLTGYGPVVELWFDGGWDKGNYDWHDARRWHWEELYAHIKSLQPECLVINNPGTTHRGEIHLYPVDLLCVERVHLRIGSYLMEPDTRPVRVVSKGDEHPAVYLPCETCDTIRQDWFYHAEDTALHSPETIVSWINLSQLRGGNLLLSAPPDDRGLLLEEDCEVLRRVGELLGE